MKNEDQSLERVIGWAREVQSQQEFSPSTPELQRGLAAFRQVRGEAGDGLLPFLKWAVACSIVVMVLSIGLNHDALTPEFASEEFTDAVPAGYFQAQVSTMIYQP